VINGGASTNGGNSEVLKTPPMTRNIYKKGSFNVQKAILPLKDARVTAGWHSIPYLRRMGFKHFGMDMADLRRTNINLVAPFDMKIIAYGNDTLMGNTIIAVSVHKVNVHYGKYKGDRQLTNRMDHLSSIGRSVRKGAIINQGEYIGRYGSTGKYGGSAHLHVELDVDVKYPTYSPTLSRSSNIWKRGVGDSTFNPMDCFKVGEGQSLTYESSSGSWVIPSSDATTFDVKGKLYKGRRV